MKMQTEVIKMNIHLGEKGQMAKEVQSGFFRRANHFTREFNDPRIPG